MTLAALNYSTAAIEELEYAAPGLAGSGLIKTANAHREMALLLREAVKFNLPDGGNLVALEKSDDRFSEFIRLPFDAVALEAPCPPTQQVYDGHNVFRESLSTKRIAVCWNSSMSSRFPTLCPPAGDRPGFYLASVYFHDASKRWTFCPLGLFVPENPGISQGAPAAHPGYQTAEREFLVGQKRLPQQVATYESHTVMLCQEAVGIFMRQSGSPDDAIARLSMDLRDESVTALGFCLTINASNVGRAPIPAPEKLNKKRIKNGRPPFFESWVLDLVAKSPTTARPASGYLIDGQRNPPRAHLRRGHIRRLGPDHITFVRAATIGAAAGRGQVDKVYRL